MATAQKRQIPISTGELPFPYQVVDVVVALHVEPNPAFRALNISDAMKKTNDMLEQAAKSIGANAVLWTRYNTVQSTVGLQIIATGTGVVLK